MKCHLCLQERELCESHIISEFFYRDSYDDKHKMSILKEQDPRIYRSFKGEYEKLLCADCERFLNQTYENYFDNFWYRKRTLPAYYHHSVFIVKGMDWIKFRLLMLSILWRASISSRETFSKISLGEHEERIRVMIKNQDPGDFFELSNLWSVITISWYKKGYERFHNSAIHGSFRWRSSFYINVRRLYLVLCYCK